MLRQVENAARQDKPLEYEILVDDFVVVPRNSDPANFNSFSDYITSGSRTVTIALYRGINDGQEKFFFELQTPPAQKEEKSLGEIPDGLSLAEWREKEKEKWKKEMRLDSLEKENADLQKALEEKSKALAESEEKYSKLKEGKMLSMSEIGKGLLSGFLEHPFVQKKVSTFQGFGVTPNKTEAEQTVTFSRKGESQEVKEEVAEVLTDQEQLYLKYLRDLEYKLSPDQFQDAMHIIHKIVGYPAVIGSTLKHISNFLSSRPKEENDEKV